MLIDLVDGADVEERRGALHRFLEAWYERPLTGVDWEAPDGCPGLLSWWHGLVLANPVLAGTQNHFEVPESEVVDPFVRYQGGALEGEPARPLWFFYGENQGVVSWGCESGEDPVVWAGSDWPPTHSPSWSREAESLSGFLVGAVMLETMYGAEAAARGRPWSAATSMHCPASRSWVSRPPPRHTRSGSSGRLDSSSP
ncbi:MAG: hypothetical protein AB8I08_10095 [Sandaracinaceae bacterium]